MEEREKVVKIYLNRRERREEREKNFRGREFKTIESFNMYLNLKIQLERERELD